MTHTASRASVFIARRIEELAYRRSQSEIARLSGFPSVNVLSAIKNDKVKVPLGRVAALADALDVPRGRLFELAVEQAFPDPATNPFHVVFGGVLPTDEEIEHLKRRRASAA